jgi:putative membrane protein
MFGFGSIFMILFWIFLVYLIVVVLRRGGLSVNNENHAMDILKERYAKGEITKEQFESMKKDLQ